MLTATGSFVYCIVPKTSRGSLVFSIGNGGGGNFKFELDNIKVEQVNSTFQPLYTAVLNTMSDQYAFGAPMQGRNYNAPNYRYGFNGKENDRETVGTGSGTQDYGFRIYNPNLGEFLSVDPLSKSYPWNSPYAFAENRPIEGIDLEGLEFNSTGKYMDFTTGKVRIDYTAKINLINDGKILVNTALIEITAEYFLSSKLDAQGTYDDPIISFNLIQSPSASITIKLKDNLVLKKDGKVLNGVTATIGNTQVNAILLAKSSNNVNRYESEIGETLGHELGHLLGLKHPFHMQNENGPQKDAKQGLAPIFEPDGKNSIKFNLMNSPANPVKDHKNSNNRIFMTPGQRQIIKKNVRDQQKKG